MLQIKVLGLGESCATCKKVDSLVRKVVAEMGLKAEIIRVAEWAEIKKYPIIATPGLVVNEKLLCSGRVPSEAEVTTWLVDAEMAKA